MSEPVIYNVLQDIALDKEGVLSSNPGWVIAILRLSKPLTYSRKQQGSVGEVISGAFQRKEQPLIISNALSLTIHRSKDSHTKNLTATLKSSDVNFLSANAVLPGDWVFAWCHSDEEFTQNLIKRILNGENGNNFMDGLKFVGRAFSIRKKVGMQNTVKSVSYSLQAVGFQELDAQFYYDVHLAASVAKGQARDIALFMAHIGLDWTSFVGEQVKRAGNLKDNMNELIPALVNTVIGKGMRRTTDPLGKGYGATGDKDNGIRNNKLTQGGPQAFTVLRQLKEAPYSYIIPVGAARILGKEYFEKSKQSVFGYSDILNLLIGVQRYSNESDTLHKGFFPEYDKDIVYTLSNRYLSSEPVKGTYLPQEGNFINKPLWNLLQQFLNPAINEMYTALKVDPLGFISPTLVVRQIPFSTQAAIEYPEMKLTRFLELPRWKIDPSMVLDADLGRSDATHFNLVKVIGDAALFSQGGMQIPARQEVLNPPILDTIDIARSGVRPYMQTVNCTIKDLNRVGGLRVWSEAIADWTIGSQFTLNGVLTCKGIQAPIAEGDNIEFEDIVYHIESIQDSCVIQGGIKTYTTTLALTNGMPKDQKTTKGTISEDFPRYPGFSIGEPQNVPNWNTEDQGTTIDTTSGNDEDLTGINPGMTEE